jgi:RNA-splicing ligase RtcB
MECTLPRISSQKHLLTLQIVTSYLDSAARNMGFKEQLQVMLLCETVSRFVLTPNSMTKGMPKPRST